MSDTTSTYSNELDKELHKIIARHDGLHGITHNIMGGKMLSEEHCANCRETAKNLKQLFEQATKAAEVRGKLWGIDLAFDCHDYDRIRKVKAELKAQLPEQEKEK